jgi:GTPase SAR1 family protein
MDSNDGITIKRLNVNELNPNEELINYKIILVGDSSVGKTCLLMRAVNNKFTDTLNLREITLRRVGIINNIFIFLPILINKLFI